LSIGRVLHMCCLERVFDINKVKIAHLGICNLLIVRVEFEPLVHVAKCSFFG